MTATPTASGATGFGRAIEILAKAANFTPIKQEVVLADGTEFVFYAAPLTAAERETAQKEAKSDSANDFALQLLIRKALDENGEKIFRPGDIPVLKREVENEDLDKLLMCVLKPRGESGDKQPEPKSN